MQHQPTFDGSGEDGGREGRCRSSVNQLGLCWREPCHQFKGGHLKVRRGRDWVGRGVGGREGVWKEEEGELLPCHTGCIRTLLLGRASTVWLTVRGLPLRVVPAGGARRQAPSLW